MSHHKFNFKFLVNWFIFSLNLLVTFSSALALFNSKNKHEYIQLKYLYPITIIIGFFISFTSKKNLCIIFCKVLFYIFLILLSAYMSGIEIKSGDELMASIILCLSDLSLIVAEYIKHLMEKKIKKELKKNVNKYVNRSNEIDI